MTPDPRALPRGLAHVAIAVPDAEAVARRYEELFGARVTHPMNWTITSSA